MTVLTPARTNKLLSNETKRLRNRVATLEFEIIKLRKELSFSKHCVKVAELKLLRLTQPRNLELSDTLPALLRPQA